jgi:hypothetical protein
MKNQLILTSIVSAFVLMGVASAQTGSGTLGVTATLSGSINLTFISDGSGVALTNSGTSAAALPFGNVRFYAGTVPAGVIKTTTGTTSFTLSTPFDVRADLANSASATFILTATLNAADPTNVWFVNSVNISDGGAAQLTATGAYASNVPYTLHLTIPTTEVAGLITNTINMTAVGN